MYNWIPSLVTGKVYNKHLTEKSVAYAKMPSIFPIFAQIFSHSENFVSSIGFLRVAEKSSRGQNLRGEKTSLNADVKYNNFERLKSRRGTILEWKGGVPLLLISLPDSSFQIQEVCLLSWKLSIKTKSLYRKSY